MTMTSPLDTAWCKARLKALGRTHEDVAQALGRDRTGATRLLNNHSHLKLADLVPLARVLDVSPLEILSRAGVEEAGEALSAMATAGSHQRLDRELFVEVIESAFEWADTIEQSQSPREFAEVCLLLYDLILRDRRRDMAGDVDHGTLNNVLQLIGRR